MERMKVMKYEEPNMLIMVFYGEDIVRTSNVEEGEVPGLGDETIWPI